MFSKFVVVWEFLQPMTTEFARVITTELREFDEWVEVKGIKATVTSWC